MMANRLTSLAVLVMLAFATTITCVSAQNSALTPELLSKILGLIAREGIERDIPPLIANALGLSATGQSWPSRQEVYKETRSGILHFMAVSRGNDQDIVVSLRKPDNNPDNMYVFRVRRDGTLVTAVIFDIQTRQLTVLNRAEAQKKLEAEILFWNGQKLLE